MNRKKIVVIVAIALAAGGASAAYFLGLFGGISHGAANHPPAASFIIKNSYSIRYGKPVSFDASSSSDPDGDPLTYEWDFGDGASGSEKEVSHTYNSAGNFVVKLTVSDGRGGTNETSRIVKINHIPIAKISIKDPDGRTVSSSYTNTILTFNASGSIDYADDITGYKWEFGDGSSAEGAIVRHKYGQMGVYKLNLTVADAAGNKDRKMQSLSISYRAIYSGNITAADVLGKDFAVPVPAGSGFISVVFAFNSTLATPPPTPPPPGPVPVPPVPPPTPSGGISMNLSILDPQGNTIATAKSESDLTIISLFGAGWKVCRLTVPYKLINASGYGGWTARVAPMPNLASYANVPYVMTVTVAPALGGMLTMNYEGYVTSADSNPALNSTLNFPIPVVNGTFSISAALVFDAGVVEGVPLGYLINDLDLYLFDNNGTAVAHSNMSKTHFPPDNATNITVTLQFESIAYYAKTYVGLTPGEWKVGIALRQGARVQYWLTVTAIYFTK